MAPWVRLAHPPGMSPMRLATARPWRLVLMAHVPPEAIVLPVGWSFASTAV